MLISLAKTHEPHILMTRPLWPGFFGETPRLQGARPIRSFAMIYFITDAAPLAATAPAPQEEHHE